MAVAAKVASTVRMWQRIVYVCCVFFDARCLVVRLGGNVWPGVELLAFAGDATNVWAARFMGGNGGDGNEVQDSMVDEELRDQG